MANATRYYDRLTGQIEAYLSLPNKARERGKISSLNPGETERMKYESYAAMLAVLRSDKTKRLLFDARQAMLFDELDEEPPSHVQRLLKMPFDRFYLEFTEPVQVSTGEPGHTDAARAFLVGEEYANAKVPHPDTGEIVDVPVRNLTLFLSEGSDYIDRTWLFSLETGWAFTRAAIARGLDSDPSEVPPEWEDDHYVIANWPILTMPGRRIGWWERAIDSYSSLFSWILAYIMAKSVKVVQEPESRQVRRWREQRNLPPMWHVVTVEPKFFASRDRDEGEPVGHHSYRYDVIGHLRFGHHKTRDGYNDTIEWVPPHQRGLANELYIPSTHKVEGGKRVSTRMSEYFREDK